MLRECRHQFEGEIPYNFVYCGSKRYLHRPRKMSERMIKPVAIDHLVLRTDRYQELIAFYCTVLGCALERSTTVDFGLTQLRAGNALIDIVDVCGELGKAGGPAPGPAGNNLDHFCLQVEPFEEVDLVAYLKSHNVEVSDFAERYGAQGMGRSVYLKDIAGNTVELRSTI